VGVGVDDPRRHHQAGGVDGPPGLLPGELADGGDAAIGHPDIGHPARQA
jgi:hypothetical protein